MGLVPVGLGIGLGKAVGTTFLIGFDNAFITGAGALTSFSAGISAVHSSLSTLQLSLVGIVGGIAAFLGVFAGVKNITSEVSSGTATLKSIFIAMIPIIAGLTAGFIAFSIAFNSTGIGLLVTLAVGAVAALAGLVMGIDEAGQKAYEKTTDFQMMEEIIGRSADTSDRCKTAMDNMTTGINSIQTASDEFAMASSLLTEIMDINENANASAYELAEMQTKVDILNGLGIEGLSLSIDETTGRVTQSREEVEKLISSLEQEAKMEAMRDLLVQSYKDQYTAMADAERALNDYNVANEALKKTSDELAECSWFDFKKRSELKAAQEEETKALNAAKQAYDDCQKTITTLDGTIDTYTGELANMKLAEKGIGEELEKGLEGVETSLEETAEKMPGLGKDIADGLKNGVTDNVKQEDYESVWSKIGNWFTNLFGIHSPSTVFAEYGGDVSKGLLNGVDKNTKQTDYDGVFGRLKTWFSNLLGTSEGDSSVFKKLGGYVASGLFGGIKTNTKQTDYDGVFSQLKTWFTSLFGIENDKSSIFNTLGSAISSGLFGGIDGGVSQESYETIFGRISSAMTSVKTQIVNVINSILTYIEGLVNGVIGGINKMITRLNSLRINAPDWVEEMFGISSFGFNIPYLSTVTIPRVQLMANGGFVDTGQMFIAREAGAEMVGNIGRKTAVANNDQIVAGIASGVASANSESNALLREQNELLREMLAKESGVYLDGKTITKSVEKHQRERGRVLVTGGAY